MNTNKQKRIILVLLPLALIILMSVIFQISKVYLGKYEGYLFAKAIYWVFGGMIFPSIILKRSIFSVLFEGKTFLTINNWWVIALFSSTIIIPIFMYKPYIKIFSTPIFIVLFAIPFSIVNGFSEESLWRGLYIKCFPKSILWGILIPSISFSLWHFVPQIIIPHANSLFFVISTFPLGIIYAMVAFRTKSQKWSAIGHSISGILALSGPDALCLYNIIHH